MPSVIGQPRRFEDKFKFLVEIDGVTSAGFARCSALEVEIEKIEYREGGVLVPYKAPGLGNISDLTLERGAVYNDTDLWDWFKSVVNTRTNTGAAEDLFRRNLDIVVLNRDNTERYRWRCFDTWPMKFTAGDWDADASEHTITSVVLAVQNIDRVVGTAA
jgi:phage tail-like protein